jgi:rfaE bifunctional protein kinase chain/domain/rfaE bifunctional protein nucleotidyltransferase chain/domain
MGDSDVSDIGMPRGRDKIYRLEQLSDIIAQLKVDGKKIIHCHGVFDLVHPGHIRHLESASKLGDVLVVTITTDRHVNKGPGKPVFNSQLRAETLSALECVKFVAVNEMPTAVNAILSIKPDLYVKGPDYSDAESDVTGMIKEEASTVESVGGKIHLTDDMTMSSSELLNTHFNVFDPATQEWLNDLKSKYTSVEIKGYLNNIQNLNILVVGEAIIDEYYFCEGLGKTAKDPILAFKYNSQESYIGGSLAVANHLSGICANVGIISMIGEKDHRMEFINERLHPNVTFYPVGRPGAPTIHKRRYVDTHTGGKVFELYTVEDSSLDNNSETQLIDQLKKTIKDYDLVVVPDYGHGMMTQKIIEYVSKNAPFMAVNTQANAGNRGFNTISRYPKADYVCLNGGEIQLEMRMRQSSFEDMVTEISNRFDCPKYTITLGQAGTLHFDDVLGFTKGPALAVRITDRVGAGDAVLSVTAPLVFKNTPWDIVAFLSNLAGAEAVAELGTSKSVNRATLSKHIDSILK